MKRASLSSAAALLILCACAPVVRQDTGAELVGNASALALPAPGGPEVVGIVERRYSNAIEQTVALETRASTVGQNSLGVRVLGLGRAKGDDALAPTAMTDDLIAAEMRAAFPGVAMSVSPALVQNAYGPFGYAVGRGAGSDLCLYGWQWIGGEVTTPFVRQGAIETRLRVCQAGADERTLLAGMYGYTVQASFGPGWSTGNPAPLLPAAIGAVGVPIYPTTVQVAAATPEPTRRSGGTAPRARPDRGEPAIAGAAPVSGAAVPVIPAAPAPDWAAAALPVGSVPVVPLPSGVAPALSADASALTGPAAAPGTPRVPSPPARVVVPGLSGDVTR